MASWNSTPKTLGLPKPLRRLAPVEGSAGEAVVEAGPEGAVATAEEVDRVTDCASDAATNLGPTIKCGIPAAGQGHRELGQLPQHAVSVMLALLIGRAVIGLLI